MHPAREPRHIVPEVPNVGKNRSSYKPHFAIMLREKVDDHDL